MSSSSVAGVRERGARAREQHRGRGQRVRRGHGVSRRTSRPCAQPAPRSGLRITSRGYAVVLLVLVLLLLAAFTLGRSGTSQATEQPAGAVAAPTVVTVEQGDSLWSIARRVAPGQDPRRVVAQIKRLNHLSTVEVQAGRQLVLPAVV